MCFYDNVLNKAIARSSTGTAYMLAKEIGISSPSMGKFVNWRKTGKFPSDETLKKIAEKAEIDFKLSHFAKMSVSSKNPEIRTAYKELLPY